MIESFDAAHSVLVGTTATVAIVHALVGIDHSLPFIVMSKAHGWSFVRTMTITAGCGAGHVASSVVIGGLGAVVGSTLESLAWVEAARGQMAAALLIGFGLAYAAWGVWRMRRSRTHSHLHAHADGTVHAHPHDHHGEHLHPHGVGPRLTPWALFVLLLLGPCEPLIPLMVVPAMEGAWLTLAAVIGVFAALTVGTMAVTVAVGYHGLHLAPGRGLMRWADPAAGLVVAASGAAVLFLGV